MNKTSPISSYVKAIALLVALVLGLMAYNKISSIDFSEKLLQTLESGGNGYSNRTEFTEAQKDSIKKTLAGFWIYRSDSSTPVSLNDHIELKDNGIVWETKVYRYKFEDGTTDSLINVIFGYANPFAPADEDSTRTISEFTRVRQAWIWRNDTCYGKSYDNSIWNFKFEPEKLEIIGNVYTPYGDSDLTKFFPGNNIISIVDRVDIDECDVGFSFYEKSREIIKAHIKRSNSDLGVKIYSEDLVRKWYIPYVLRKFQFTNPMTQFAPEIKFKLDIVINSDGTVRKSQFKSRQIRGKSMQDLVNNEIMKWSFPDMTQDSLKISMFGTLYKKSIF